MAIRTGRNKSGRREYVDKGEDGGSKQKWLVQTAMAKGGEIKEDSRELGELLAEGYEPFHALSVHEPMSAATPGSRVTDWHEARDVVIICLRKRVDDERQEELKLASE